LRPATSPRALPAVHRFLAEPELAAHAEFLGTTVVKAAVDAVLAAARGAALRAEAVPPYDALLGRVRERLASEETAGLVGVLNATGVLLHTNLGRAPLAREALDAIAAIACGYSNLEYDLEHGSRGSRYGRVTPLLCAATGARDALVVNNCAAAVLLILDTFAKGREVVVSRNQLVEIGGGFRLPDVLARSGATLIEVGATNKVYLADFERALSTRTALLLRSHTSNYRIEGFTADVAPSDLAALGKRAGIPSVEDLGSGALVDLAPFGLPHERTVSEAVADGIDLVAFSGDKLLGGPQAGIIVGNPAPIARLRANPLLRALRVDKATLAALAATLRLHVAPGGLAKIPLYAMLGAGVEGLRARAEAIAGAVPEHVRPAVAGRTTEAYAGGGSSPLATLPSYGLELRDPLRNADALAQRLRRGRPRVAGRIADGAVVLDLRTVPAERDGELRAAIVSALS
jgi:L-seryl-tRNA(Ser) seleniumtransferase